MSEQEKPVSFEALVQQMAWDVMAGLLRGVGLQTLIQHVCHNAVHWRRQMDKYEGRP